MTLVEDDGGFANVTFVYSVIAEWALFPGLRSFEIEILEQASVAKEMTALRNSRCNHEARRLHTDRTLRFLIGRKGGRLSVNDLDDVAPFDDGAGVIQVLDVTTLLLLCRLYPPLSNSNLSFRSG